MRFFIRDCNESIVGNPAGYRTMRGAQCQESNPRSPASRAIRAAYDARMDYYDATCMPLPFRRRNLCSIRRSDEQS